MDVYTDEALSRIETPCLLMVGDREVIYKVDAVMARATRLMKNLKTTLIRNASHLLNLEQPDQVNRAILSFIDGDPIASPQGLICSATTSALSGGTAPPPPRYR